MYHVLSHSHYYVTQYEKINNFHASDPELSVCVPMNHCVVVKAIALTLDSSVRIAMVRCHAEAKPFFSKELQEAFFILCYRAKKMLRSAHCALVLCRSRMVHVPI